MGTIRVGQKSPKTVDMGGFTVVPNGATNENKGMTAEEKAKLIEEIGNLPKEQIVPTLRKHGFNEIADITEAQMKQADAEAAKKAADAEAEEKKREIRLNEILSLPVEEQLPLLLAEGYEDEAKALSEKLAAEQEQKKTDAGTGDENTGTEAPADGTTSELNDEGTGEANMPNAGTEAPESGEAPADAAPAEEPEKKPKTPKTPKGKK
jgi:hypothetical protein